MDIESRVLSADQIPGRGTTVNPFAVVPDAVGLIQFLVEVFDAEEVSLARTATPAGLLIHAEVRVGDSLLLLADPQPGWPSLPGLFQVWVKDAAAIIAAATSLGARVVTPPTPFYGSLTLARFEDPWSNFWWLFQPAPGQDDPKPAWDGGSKLVFSTIDEYMRTRERVEKTRAE